MKKCMTSLRASLGLLALFSILLGGVYPLAITVISKILFTDAASGSLLQKDGKIIGSSLLGQEFTQNNYFWGRLSATSPAYNAASSSGSNYSPANPKLLEAANARIEALQKADPKNKAQIPVELITASASGLDPHISLLAAEYQMGRVAKARGLQQDVVHALIIEHILPQSQFFGSPYVSVLELNLALDELK